MARAPYVPGCCRRRGIPHQTVHVHSRPAMRRDESRRGTQKCVRHDHAWAGVRRSSGRAAFTLMPFCFSGGEFGPGHGPRICGVVAGGAAFRTKRSTFTPRPAMRRDESRRGTQKCVRHDHAWAGVRRSSGRAAFTLMPFCFPEAKSGHGAGPVCAGLLQAARHSAPNGPRSLPPRHASRRISTRHAKVRAPRSRVGGGPAK